MSLDERKAKRPQRQNARALFRAWKKGRKMSGMSSIELQSALSRTNKNANL